MTLVSFVFWFSVVTIVYVYAGFPLLLTLLSFLRPRRLLYPPDTPHVTLLIAAYNEEAVIAQKIENCNLLDYPRERLQVMVAADGSDDRTREIVSAYAPHGVELSYSKCRKGKLAAIQCALPKARGEIVIFSDANNLYTPNAVRELVAPFADPSVGCVGGAKTIVRGDGVLCESEGLYWKYENFIKKQESRLGCCTSAVGEIFAIRRALIEICPDYIINDDFYLAMRAIRRGYRMVYAPEARSIERISFSQQDEVHRRARIVAGRYQAMAMACRLLPMNRPVVVWQIVSHKFLRPLLPFAMFGALVANIMTVTWPCTEASRPFLQLAFPYNWIMLSLQGIFYGLAFSAKRIRAKGIFSRILYLPAFLVNSNLAALIGLYRYLSKNQTPLWQRAKRRKIIDPPQG